MSKISINTLASQIGLLSEEVKLYMKLLTAHRYYALNDRTINMLSHGDVDMSAATSSEYVAVPASNTVCDAEVEELLDIETEVDTFVVDKNKTIIGGAFLKYLDLTNFDL